MIESGWNTLIHILNTMPAWLAAVLIGWAVSAGVTQTFKFAMPVTADGQMRETIARVLAVVVAALVAGAWYAERGGSATGVILVSVGAGVWSPIAFSLLQAVLRRWWPWAADVLSGDVRGKLVGGGK